MADEPAKDSPWGWMALCKGLAIVIGALGIAVPSVISAIYSHANNAVGEQNQAILQSHGEKIDAAKQTAVEVKTDLVTATKTTNAKLSEIEGAVKKGK